MVEELTESLAEVVNAMIATDKKGALQLKLDMNPASKGDAVMTVTDEGQEGRAAGDAHRWRRGRLQPIAARGE
ncbi:hypothetical protein [Microvirgula aerodenitrificans]|uniref:hypothetical protein n=1 Tax=Microvirgula aerodenitrificans TaxID=57480 RepID=UPI00248E0FEF|nr:hypothetical protein [Microvirgula aerodenitrificans]